MLPNKSMRGRNLEDLGELEEKALLRRISDGDMSDDGVRRRGKERGLRYEKVVELDEGSSGEGLNNPRDRQAFALLVVLCQYDPWYQH